ncbi:MULTISPECIES: gamma-glutamyl-gamma-aminobutyrate hydrolase family protein [Prauserella salsuginis group]|uniref:Gamma-glutamyl-gamma-aminobutyrate hydrolase family protein n=1 Tax=Prauserella salsuginis TaxID=387889 RepID=A0ABW6G103_9PSEU|nr:MULTISPECIES: gamma-glutamyl-gamma-aminobutyrate hydrolase family protein [Prauserella salsuginis group]MCR3722030.1 putative glutamine amidotransferase [Prauserella flava]MCR3736036.1 putative glutamine amidotransferase [Prauserella salsuginis]
MTLTRYVAPTAASPLIGLTGRRKRATIMAAPQGFADAPIDVYFAEFATSVQGAGALAVHLPLDGDARALVARIDGLVLVGGDDVDPRRYGQSPGPFTTVVDPACDQFEIDLVVAALERDIPVLGVCRGQQILNVALGGTLQQHLEIGEGESHGSYAYPRAHRVHDVEFTEGSTHAAVYGTRTKVNSFHHQAVEHPGDGVTVVGHAPDGTPEAIEVAGTSAIGVQWHPETFGGDPIFDWLARTAAATAQSTRDDDTQEVTR